MSATAAKKQSNQKQRGFSTTCRGAALYITLGMFCLTLGLGWIICLMTAGSSFTLDQLRLMLLGLGGPLCPALPVLLLWGGAKLLVSSRHRVSVRNFFVVFSLFWLTLAGYTLIAKVPQSTGFALPYLDFVKLRAKDAHTASSVDFTACLNQAYLDRSSGAGGLMGMLLAYPLSQALGRVGAELLVACLMIALFLILFRLNPAKLFRTASDLGEKRRQHRQQIQQENQTPRQAGGYEAVSADNMPVSQDPSAMPPPSYYQPAPIYDPQAAPARDEQGFFPVQPDLYEEQFPLEQAPQPAAMPQQTAPKAAKPGKAVPARQEKPGLLNWIRDTFASAPVQDQPGDSPAQAPAREAAPAPKPAARPAAQALDTDEYDLPWEEPANGPSSHSVVQEKKRETPKSPVPKPHLPAEAEYKPRHGGRENKPVQAAAPASAAPAAPAPKLVDPPVQKPGRDASWADQVNQKKAELDQPRHTTAKNDPQPVYTDPVMPITGERIPINPPKEKKETGKDQRLDGTSAPKVKQGSMNLSVPYQAPPMRLLKESKYVPQENFSQQDEYRAQVIESTLRSFKVESEVKQIVHGPAITRFAIQIAPGVRVSQVNSTADNLALELKTKHVRVEAPIQGTNYIGIEVPNQVVSTVSLREVLESPEMQNSTSPLVVALGKDIAGAPILCDLSKMPHLLIAGATGSGKSVCINSIVCSLLYRTSPDQVRLIMVDPKQVELSVYNGIPHLLVPVVSDPRKAAGALSWVVQEMLERYSKFSAQNVRSLAGYNKVNEGTDQVLPNIVVIIDEMADLMEVCRKDVEESIRRLAALARAAGIYMVLATQRPSVDVITGVIKNNIPSRIAFAVSSGTDSRTIIDINGAEKLMGKGDMLYKPTGASPMRVQGCFVSDEEVNAIAEYISQRYQTNYDPNITEHMDSADKEPAADEITASSSEDDLPAGDGSFQDLLRQAIEMAVEDGQTSTSMLQRRLRIGYARAGRLIDEMEKRGIISQADGSKPRKVLMTREEYVESDQRD